MAVVLGSLIRAGTEGIISPHSHIQKPSGSCGWLSSLACLLSDRQTILRSPLADFLSCSGQNGGWLCHQKSFSPTVAWELSYALPSSGPSMATKFSYLKHSLIRSFHGLKIVGGFPLRTEWSLCPNLFSNPEPSTCTSVLDGGGLDSSSVNCEVSANTFHIIH